MYDCRNAICVVLCVQCCGCDFSPKQFNVIDCCRHRLITTQFIQLIGRTFLGEAKIKSNRFLSFFFLPLRVCEYVCVQTFKRLVFQCGRVIHTCLRTCMVAWSLRARLSKAKNEKLSSSNMHGKNATQAKAHQGNANAKARAQLQENSLKSF